MHFDEFLIVRIIHFRIIFLISYSSWGWSVLSYSGLLLVVPEQQRLSMLSIQ